MSKRAVVLIILDGWGIGREDSTNPIYAAQPPTINHIKGGYQSGSLQASGIAVGLPWGEEGNSEVGHLTIGAGKILYQHFPRITLAIQKGDFFKNKALLDAANHALKHNSAINLAGLLTEGNVHASFDHLPALIKLVRSVGKNIPIKLHLFSDGKDSPPKSILTLLEKLDKVIGEDNNIKISSLSGRYFAMDRDRHWGRTQEAYQAMVGNKDKIGDIKKYINQQYEQELKDVFLPPASLNSPLSDNDALIFFNFREDSIRQLASAFAIKDFKEFKIKPLKNLYLATITQYSDKFQAQVAFPPEKITNPLGKVLADEGKFQLRIAETEKYAHVTYFFNGLTDKPSQNEFRILIPSRNIIRHEDYPEMMAAEIGNRVVQALEEQEMDFILANFANPDIIAHTGNFDAALAAVKVVDEQLGKIIKAALATNATIIITSDHGNIERMYNPTTGEIETSHDPSPVPIYLIGQEFTSSKNKAAVRRSETEAVGVLQDIAPTILSLMKINQPKEMSGQSLLGKLY